MSSERNSAMTQFAIKDVRCFAGIDRPLAGLLSGW
jgi:hypothetical protein